MSEERALDWDDSIQKESNFVLLDPGDYTFTIDHFERGQHNGSDKIPPCPKAIVYFNVDCPDGGQTQLSQNYFLHTKMEWKISELFRSVGLKKEGEEIRMEWNKLPGLSGKCKVGQVEGYKDPSKTYNSIEKLYPKEPGSTGKSWASGKW